MTTTDDQPSVASRITAEGRKISYSLNVCQQPVRARACGQGAKSSSDRRPVDPPPVVELRVLEGDDNRDITHLYNANFFLVATLEHARQIAHPRGSQSTQAPPVLTGSPVAGISYLERPSQAGYFIYPDLSVRHEGKYRLVFVLFEEPKEERDFENAVQPTPTHPSNSSPSLVHARCEVKSDVFDVFSAKKFPGLAESTHLSRSLADQGCRVRIRRDVRMRRRESKPEKDWDNHDEAEQQTVAGSHGPISPDSGKKSVPGTTTTTTTQTAQDQQNHDRPNSVSSNQSLHPATHRHTSSHDLGHQYQYPYAHATNQQHAYAQQLQYDQSQVSQYGSSSQYMPPPSQPITQYQPHYGPAYQHPSPVNNGQISPIYPSYMNQQPVSSPTYDRNEQMSHLRNDGAGYGQQSSHGYSRSMDQNQPYSQGQQWSAPLGTSSTDNAYGRQQAPPHQNQFHQQQQQTQHLPHHSTNHSHSSTNGHSGPMKSLPPLTTPQGLYTPRNDGLSSPGNPSTTPGRQSLIKQEPTRAPPPQYVNSGSGAGMSTKRSYGSVFNTGHMDQPMRAGARPETDGTRDAADSSEEDIETMDSISMRYRRADGTYQIINPTQQHLYQ
ncbi:MAG: velvet protein [Alyxoria varia]|nr:MAG: velvet protein [Alyxoria varia]